MRLPTTLLFSVILFSSGCENNGFLGGDFRPNASGVEGQITVVIDSALWNGSTGEALQNYVGGSIETLPSPEPEFDLEATGISSQAAFNMTKERKNVLFIGLITDQDTPENKYLSTVFNNDSLRKTIMEGTPVLVARPNYWRRNQLIYYLAASSPEDLVAGLEQHSDQLRYHFNEVSRARLHLDMFDIGRQRDLEQILIDRHGFAVHAQHDYFIAVDTTQFVWLRRVLSDTWRSMFVYYEENADPSKLSADWIMDTRNAITKRYVGGTSGGWVEIDQRLPMTVEEIDFKGRFAIEFRGLWHMVGKENGRKILFGMGGPFSTYAFYDTPSRRLYLIDAMVFAPNFPKREFMRQMEVITYTFRTLEEEKRESI